MKKWLVAVVVASAFSLATYSALAQPVCIEQTKVDTTNVNWYAGQYVSSVLGVNRLEESLLLNEPDWPFPTYPLMEFAVTAIEDTYTGTAQVAIANTASGLQGVIAYKYGPGERDWTEAPMSLTATGQVAQWSWNIPKGETRYLVFRLAVDSAVPDGTPINIQFLGGGISGLRGISKGWTGMVPLIPRSGPLSYSYWKNPVIEMTRVNSLPVLNVYAPRDSWREYGVTFGVVSATNVTGAYYPEHLVLSGTTDIKATFVVPMCAPQKFFRIWKSP